MSNAFSGDFVTAVNARGEKQQIPRHWLDNPTLGREFRLPKSANPTPKPTTAPADGPKEK